MGATLMLHIAAGSVAIVSGYVALLVGKGGGAHRRSGMVFAYAMLTMAAAGFTLAVVRGAAPRINVPAALLTAYLVTTALTTVRRDAGSSRAADGGLMLLALAVGLYDVGLGVTRIASGRPIGLLFIPAFVFGSVALLAAAGDARVLRAGAPVGTARLARHLWRMCFALFIATASFFFGQAKVIPEPLRIYPVLAVLALAPLAVMPYWLWRMRTRRPRRTAPRVVVAEAA